RLLAQPGVREAVVLAREDEPGLKRLVAYVVGQRDDEKLDVDTLRQALAGELPGYMVPSAFVRLDALPLTPNGKVDRRALPAPEAGDHAQRAYEAPQGELEEQLAALWAEVLQLPRVGRHDNFFELGGHSLLAVTLIERMRQAGLASDVRALFSAPSLAQLAERLGREQGAWREVAVPPNGIPDGAQRLSPEMLPLVALSQAQLDGLVAQVPGGAANVQDIYPLAPLQEGMLFHHLMGGDGDVYLLRTALRFDGEARLQRYLDALRRLLRRHDVLRTALYWEGLDAPVQLVQREAELPVRTLTAAELGVDEASRGDEALQALLAHSDARRTRLCLQQAPLMQVQLLREPGRDSWLMVLLVHHLVVDHQALEVLQQEVAQLQTGRGDGLAPAQPFRNHVAQARLGLSTAEHEAYFRERLASVDEATLPYGMSDVQSDGSAVSEAHLDLPEALSAGLLAQARRLGVSVASLCHLAYAQLLGQVSGRDDVVFGTVLFGRMQSGSGADRALGLYINTLPLRVLLDGEAETAARRVQQDLAALLRHEHAPLALAQRCSGLESGVPLVTALMNYRHGGQPAAEAGVDAEALVGIEPLVADERTNYPLTLSVNDMGGDGLSLSVLAQSPAQPQRVCALMQQALQGLLQSLATGAAWPQPLLPASEQAELLALSERVRPYPATWTLPQLFELVVHAYPESLAAVHGERRLSYTELDAISNGLAHALIEQGVDLGDAVATRLERSLELVVAQLAILKVGAVYVPLDPQMPAARQALLVEDSGARLVLVAPDSAPLGQVATLPVSVEVLAAQKPTPVLRVPPSAEAPAYL
ncbi:condensation domain-containing protein, partial [Pelomonas sp. CA6]|uniref:condensation domain-containing protein n=1 Tax=Pelomonas sp. CA6 TaxID=2907999 RepID=UPI001F4C0158